MTTPTSTAIHPITVERLRTEYLLDPVGLDTPQPRLSWMLVSHPLARGVRQTAYRILVASTPELLAHGTGDIWDSGRVESSTSTLIQFDGRPLVSGDAYHWKVQIWDQAEQASAWSVPARWTMGLLRPGDWTAQWISFRDTSPLPATPDPLHLPPARHYRKSFSAPRQVVRATLFASALGICDLHLNGRRVGDALFEPGWTDYRQRAYYRTHDVTALLRQGGNTIGAIVADGWYAGYIGYALLCGYGPNRIGRNLYGKTPALLAQLHLEYADGARETVGTDTSWQVSGDGPFREADILMGERFDAGRDDPRWCVDSVEGPWSWEPAIRAEDNGPLSATFHESGGARQVELGFQRPPRLQAYAAPPIRITQEVAAVALNEPTPGVYLFDLGQNFAGTIRLRVAGAAGTRLTIRYGEMCHQDGRLMTENLRRARATDVYILCGASAGETWIPTFTYHGFRYVEISGLAARPDLGAVTGLVMHNDTELVGSFSCSDPVMTRFAQNALWTQRANFIEVPTDCPQRDERLGWMGDAQAYVRTASYFADVGAFFTKWLDDVEEAQCADGAYPDYCPYPMAHGKPGATYGTAWTDAGVICPWTIWQVYGDTRVVSRHWDSMRRFMDWRRRSDPQLQGVDIGNGWGDWLNVKEDTPITYVDLCYHALDARMMADMAGAIGAQDEAVHYQRLFDEAAASFRRLYLQTDGSLSVQTQSAYVLALWVGLIPADVAPASAGFLAERIRRNDHRMATGFLGTKPLLSVLTRNGQHELAVRLFLSRRFPSWGYEVANGATSVWERWDSFTREFGFNGADGGQNAGMNSFSHYAFGAVMEWAFRDLAGIDTHEAGFGHLLIRPGPSDATDTQAQPLSWVKAAYQHPRGHIGSEWTRAGDRLQLDVTIPANTVATVHMPTADPQSVSESGNPAAQAPGVSILRTEVGAVVFRVGSGSYRFASLI